MKLRRKRPEPDAPRQRSLSVGSRFYRGAHLPDHAREQELLTQRAEHQNRVQQAAQAIKSARQHEWLIRLALIAALLLTGSRLFVTSAAVSPSQPAMQATAKQYLSSYWWQRFKPFLNEQRLEAAMERVHADSGTFEARQHWYSTKVYIKAVPHTPLVVWERSRAVRFLVDTDGVAYQQFNQAKSDLPVLRDSARLPIVQGNQVLPTTTVKWLEELLKRMRQEKLPVTKLAIGEGPRSMEVYAKGLKYYLKLSTERGVGEQLADLKDVRQHFKKRNIAPARYVDLRLASRVYYK